MSRPRISWMMVIGVLGIIMGAVSIATDSWDWWIYFLIAGAFFLLDARSRKARQEKGGSPSGG